MLGFLLARAGIDVIVLEKHADFLHDFRGDTIHPSTLEIMGELGLLDEFLKLPHEKAETIGAFFGDREYAFADLRHLPTRCKFVALMPQWDFLNFLAEHGRKSPSFHLQMRTEAVDLIHDGGRVAGVRANAAGGTLEVRADLIAACDGRHSTMRARAGLTGKDLGAPMDVLWMRLPRRPGDPGQTLDRFDTGRIFVMLNREDYWQCAFVIPKGGFDDVRRRGLPSFREEIARLVPYLRDRTAELKDWSDVKLLSVSVDRLRVWRRPGCCASATLRTPCPPSGASGSTSPFRTRSPRPTSWPHLCVRAKFPRTTSAPCNGAANSRPAPLRRCRYSSRTD